MQGHQIIREFTGEGMVYPGHPLVIATAIMVIYPDYAAANAPTGLGFCEALGDSRIPGAGDHVGAAMQCLEIGQKGGTSEQMIEYAHRYWTSGRAGGHIRNVEAGTHQADAIEAKFRELTAAWFTDKTEPASAAL